MTTQHTPGPWAVDDTGYRAPGNGLCVMARPECIAVVGANNPHLPQDANARLIAAAPDLLEALHEVYRQLMNLQPIIGNGLLNDRQLAFIDPRIDMCIEAASTAITKATGEAA